MCDVGVVCVPVHRAHLNSSPAYAHWHLGVWGLLCAVWGEWAWSVWCVGRGSVGISRAMMMLGGGSDGDGGGVGGSGGDDYQDAWETGSIGLGRWKKTHSSAAWSISVH